MNAQTIMTSPAIACQPSDSLNEAARLMWQHDIGSLPVTDAAGRLVGIITDRDVCMGAYTKGRALTQISVETAMAKRPVSCKPAATINELQRIMTSHQIRRVPVVDKKGTVIGVVSLNDIVRAAEASDVRFDDIEFVRTMAAICAPRAETLLLAAS